ncbi:hypothetical protein ACFLV4_06155 [Chloroflexota bacterium]
MESAIKQNINVIDSEPVEEIMDSYRLHLEALCRSHKTISWYLEILKRYFRLPGIR